MKPPSFLLLTKETVMVASDLPRAFYRILADAEATDSDFESHAIRYVRAISAGRKPRRAPDTGDGLHMWSGVSVYASIEAARGSAAQHGLGSYIAQLEIPAAEARWARIEKTGQDEEHYTVWGRADRLRRFVESKYRV